MHDTAFPLLTLFTFAPVIGMLVILCIPSKRADIIKTVAAAAAAVPALLGFYVLFAFVDNGSIQYREDLLWIDGLNVHYMLGIDGLSAPMILLSGLVGFVAVVASWGIEKQIKGYFALILLLLTGMNGVFCALDFFLFYVFWELMLLPMYFLIGIWGGPNRVYAAIKFFLYTMAGSVLMLVVLLACWYWSDGRYADSPAQVAIVQDLKQDLLRRHAAAFHDLSELRMYGPPLKDAQKMKVLAQHGILWTKTPEKALAVSASWYEQIVNLPHTLDGSREASEQARAALLEKFDLGRTFNLLELKERYQLFTGEFYLFRFLKPVHFAALMFLFLFIAFAIKVPVFPFHTWLPWAHVEAPTAISVILAGILLKMGVYGLLRISYGLFPTMAVAFAVPIAVLGVWNIIYGACCAMAQTDMKKLVAYSSVSHMGFCLLGLAALTDFGLSGSILQMFNHGTSTSMMFLLVGVIYDRAHHRDINKFGGLATAMPVYTGFMTLALFASMGLPGLSGFISEILVFLGAFQSNMGEVRDSRWAISFQSLTMIAAIGVVLTAAYLLWMMQRVFLGPLNEKYKGYADINGREIFTLAPLCILVIFFGVYPQPLINMTRGSVEALQSHVLRSKNLTSAEVQTDKLRGDPKAKIKQHAGVEDVKPPHERAREQPVTKVKPEAQAQPPVVEPEARAKGQANGT